MEQSVFIYWAVQDVDEEISLGLTFVMINVAIRFREMPKLDACAIIYLNFI